MTTLPVAGEGTPDPEALSPETVAAVIQAVANLEEGAITRTDNQLTVDLTLTNQPPEVATAMVAALLETASVEDGAAHSVVRLNITMRENTGFMERTALAGDHEHVAVAPDFIELAEQVNDIRSNPDNIEVLNIELPEVDETVTNLAQALLNNRRLIVEARERAEEGATIDVRVDADAYDVNLLDMMVLDLTNRPADMDPNGFQITIMRGEDEVGTITGDGDEEIWSPDLNDLLDRVTARRDTAPEIPPAPVREPVENTPSQEDARYALTGIRRRAAALRAELRAMDGRDVEPSGRFNTQEAGVLNGYAENLRRILEGDEVLGGNGGVQVTQNGQTRYRGTRGRQERFRQQHIHEFRDPGQAEGMVVGLNRAALRVERAQQRVEYRNNQFDALDNLEDQLRIVRSRREIIDIVGNLEDVDPDNPQNIGEIPMTRARTYEEWNNVLDYERNSLVAAVSSLQLTQTQADNFIRIREIQRDSLASTHADGHRKQTNEFINPAMHEAYNQMTMDLGADLLVRIDTEILGLGVRLERDDLRALMDLYEEEVGGVRVGGTGAERVTDNNENRMLRNRLAEVMNILEHLADQTDLRNPAQSAINLEGAGDEVMFLEMGHDIAWSTLGEAIIRLEAVLDYYRFDLLPEARIDRAEAQEEFNNLTVDIDVSRRSNLEDELAALLQEENTLQGIASGHGPGGPEVPAVNTEIQELRDEIAALTAQLAERDQREQELSERTKKWIKNGAAFIGGAVLGALAPTVAAPIGVVAGVVAGGARLANWFAKKRLQKLQDPTSRVARRLTPPQIAQRVAIYTAIRDKLEWAKPATDMIGWVAGGITLGIGLNAWANGQSPFGSGADSSTIASDAAGADKSMRDIPNNPNAPDFGPLSADRLDLSALTDSNWAPTDIGHLDVPMGGDLFATSANFNGGMNGMAVNRFLEEAAKAGIKDWGALGLTGLEQSANFDKIMNLMYSGQSFKDAFAAIAPMVTP